ncbi:glycosyltransferase family 4 protein [Alicyclobacillus sp. SO9]|uniref:glycosyltransferase family 4 protein n=1 Tax=Alicyclobacillus sp. SO9 TaxID=2665646 RepID=UPI0018E7F05F|nr:glycosyltransferase family 4 protein [Alicyclobacillus sp. SO9]QQE79204.1 glycosyltransferase family 4 protein [Alicyclobacillus sp. SO9]
MRITFVLPGWSRKPNGGYKVVYEYCNELAKRGNQVTVVHTAEFVSPVTVNYIKTAVKKLWGLSWLDMHGEVSLTVVPRLDNSTVPDSDIIVATAYNTAFPVYRLSKAKGEKYYFIQHYEIWSGDKYTVDQTWLLPLRKIVIAKWLEQKASELGTAVYGYVPNGIDHNKFQVRVSPSKRYSHSVAMMWHESEWKGSRDGIEILKNVKETFSDLQVTFFSVYEPPLDLPSWIEFVKDPSLEELVDIYNSHAVFLWTSYSEGWGLPPVEAMACGACLVSTANNGVQEYAIDMENSRLAPVYDVNQLQSSLEAVLNDSRLRIRLALQGIKDTTRFSNASSTEKLLGYFQCK